MTALSLILPCYNEADRLPATLATYLAHLPDGPDDAEVLVVDDGSADATAKVAGAIGDARVRVIRTRPNHGKGFAVRTGMLAATGDLLVFTDVDGAYVPGDMDQATWTRWSRPGRGAGGHRDAWSRRRRAAGPPGRHRAFNQTLHLLSDLPFTDTQCGLKAFRREAAHQLFGRAKVNGFAFDVELLLLARQLGLPVAEVPVRAQSRFGSRVRVLADGRRMLGEIWSVRRDLDADHRSQRRAYA